MPDKKDFNEVFARLKAIFKPYAKKMVVVQDTPKWYYLDTHHIMKNKKPLVGAVAMWSSSSPPEMLWLPRNWIAARTGCPSKGSYGVAQAASTKRTGDARTKATNLERISSPVQPRAIAAKAQLRCASG